MTFWMGVYVFHLPVPLTGISPFQWHAHEMIYGFAMAVVAGFLLTAAKNWTGVQTPRGFSLMGLVVLWAIPRALFLLGTSFLSFVGWFDMLFISGLIAAIAHPIIKVKQWKQLGILVILALLAAANGCFYLGAAGLLAEGLHIGVYGGLFLIVGLILLMGRRVVPFFIEAGVGYPIKLVNRPWLDQAIIGGYLVFLIAELGMRNRWLVGLTAIGLFVANAVRLAGWHTPGIWRKPLLWSLFVALLWVDLGFLLLAISALLDRPALVVIHAFSVGGIGVITLSMMARVTLGHTGRNVQNPPKAVAVALVMLVGGAGVRVLTPLLAGGGYASGVAVSQCLWIAAFALFLITYYPMLVKPRVDGQPG